MRELTVMQAACWFGRNAGLALGGVAAHLYAEFDSSFIDGERLRAVLARLCRVHPMLSLRVDGEGRQTMAADRPILIEMDDFRELSADAREQTLLAKRHQWSHQQLKLQQEPPVRVSLTRIDDEMFRLHIDADMMAVDPSSFRLLVEDFALFYENPDVSFSPPPSFFNWCDVARSAPGLKAIRVEDRAWWRARLTEVAPAPSLPYLPSSPSSDVGVESTRLHLHLGQPQLQALRGAAAQQCVTLSSLMLSLFALSLGQATGDTTFRLNVPIFRRPQVMDGEERIIGEFADMVILDIHLETARDPGELCRNVAQQMAHLIAHRGYSGIEVMRDLSRHRGTSQTAPVVFTAAVDLPGGELFSERVRRCFGPMNWVISQGPQVALDAQVVSVDGGLLINWDVRLDALPLAWVKRVFDDFVALLREVADDPERLGRPRAAAVHSTKSPLTSLQQAYLLGRSMQIPLGGVAMQEFRQYRGRIDPALLRKRLALMVERHDSLRTLIDAEHRVQTLVATVRVNLREVDLAAMPLAAAMEHVEMLREDYAHAIFDLEHSPWDVTLFHLPEGELIVFARFDALILDGRSIAALMVEFFDGGKGESVPYLPALPAQNPDSAERTAAMLYWKEKLADAGGAPHLPWCRPLEQLRHSRYERQSLVINSLEFEALCKIGARQGLFKNSSLMAVILEVLSHWLDEGSLCVAVPVAPAAAGALANRSSFIAVDWRPGQGSLLERAQRLQADVLNGLQHLSFSGVDLARLLFDDRTSAPSFPVVITNGLSWASVAESGPMHLQTGLTQTPQVAMDIRLSSCADGALAIDIDHARDAIAPDIVAHILSALAKAIQSIAASGAMELDAMAVIDRCHYRCNSDESDICRDDFLGRIASRLFDLGAMDRTAIISQSTRLSYGELGAGIVRIMAGLRERELVAGQVVAVCLPRGTEHIMVTLACALMGVVWVPIDAASPVERRHYLLDNCVPDLVVIAGGAAAGLVGQHRWIDPAELLATEVDAGLPHLPQGLSMSEAPAYYLYTSGTTGKPKCVVLSNRATANVIGSTLNDWQVADSDVFISVTPLHHDMSVFDVFGCLAAGATLVLPEPGADKDAVRWNELVEEHRVTLWSSVPAMVEMLLSCRQGDSLRSLRLLAQGGDYIKPTVVQSLRELLPAARLVSLGGPTETTIWSIWHDIAAQDVERIPYGHPVPGSRYWLFNEHGDHCPEGVAGRIHTSGACLALGYLENGELVQHDFVTVHDDLGRPVRAFRTGDLGRYRHDGSLMFEGRVNGYVKVRGVRVSLPDVETELSRHPLVQQVLVVDIGDKERGEAGLGALCVCDPAAPVSIAALREHARQYLPLSHVPTRFLMLGELPLSANGKPDRRQARRLFDQSCAGAGDAVVRPEISNHLGSKVLDICLEIMGRPPGQDDMRSEFVRMGLRPRHLKLLAERLQDAWSITLSPSQLLPCRNAGDVAFLIAGAVSA